MYAWLNVFTTFDTKDALPPECWEDSNAVGPFFLSNCLMSVAIVVALVWLFLCFVLKNSISYCCCSQANNTNHGVHVLIKLQRILYSAMILVYPLICRTALASIHCVQIEGSVKNIYILASKATVECFSEAHFFNGVLGSMALLFFCFGFPAAIFLLLSVSKIFDQSAMLAVEFTVQRSYTVESVDGFRRQPNDSNRGEWSENPMNTRNSNAAEGSARRSNRSSFDLNEDRAYASVLAFVRQEKNVLFAFRPLLLGDFRIGFLRLRPIQLCLIFALSFGSAFFPPSSTYAVHRTFVTMALVISYYSALVWFRPFRYSRRWIFPVQLSIGFISLLSLVLIAFIELSGVGKEVDKQAVDILSWVSLVCGGIVIVVVIPMSSVYELLKGARKDIA